MNPIERCPEGHEKKKPKECEDCGDDIPKGQRRRKCPRCGKMICGWCANHVHILSIVEDLERENGELKAKLSKLDRPEDALQVWRRLNPR